MPQVKDVPDRLLGLASGRSIWLDINAAGWGWFVDSTPEDDREFLLPGDQGEACRMDLLSAVMHEIGHVLGLDHEDDTDDAMYESLSAGQRTSLNQEIKGSGAYIGNSGGHGQVVFTR